VCEIWVIQAEPLSYEPLSLPARHINRKEACLQHHGRRTVVGCQERSLYAYKERPCPLSISFLWPYRPVKLTRDLRRLRLATYEMNGTPPEAKVTAFSATTNEAPRISGTSHTKPAIVLIHGLWMTPACWEDWGAYFTNLGMYHIILIGVLDMYR